MTNLWLHEAACVGEDPELWCPTSGWGAYNTPAYDICNQCPVRRECAQYAVSIEDTADTTRTHFDAEQRLYGVIMAGVYIPGFGSRKHPYDRKQAFQQLHEIAQEEEN